MFKRPLINFTLLFILGSVMSFMILNKNFFGTMLVIIIVVLIYYGAIKKINFLILVIFMLIGSMRFYLFFNIYMNNNEKIRIIKTNYYGCVASFRNRNIYVSGNIKNLKPGMLVDVEGNFEKQPDFSKGIVGRYNVEHYFVYENDLIYKMYSVKEKIYNKYLDMLGDNAQLIMALCLGDSHYLSYQDKNDFKKLGIIHLLCISGFHISIMYKLFQKIFGNKISPILCFLYVIFTGAKAPALRSYIMILIYRFSNTIYRRYDPLSSISFAALVLLVLRPYYILDIGFNLSFLAVIGIVLCCKKLNNLFYKLPKYLNDALSLTISAQIFTVPYISFTIKDFSLFSLIGNIVLVPIYSFAIILGNASLMVIPIKILFRYVCYILKSLFYVINGANYVFLKFCPDLIQFNEYFGVCLLTIYTYYYICSYYSRKDNEKQL